MAADVSWYGGPAKYGFTGAERTSHDDEPVAAVAGSLNPAGAFHPDNPLFWFGVIAAVSIGLMAGSAHVRVGKRSANVSVGDDAGKG